MPSLPSHTLNTLVTALVHSRNRLLQCCLRWSSSLWHPSATVSPQHSRTSGRRLIATRSRDFSATRPPLHGCQSHSASSTSCVWWYIAACTATHHRTWSRRRPLQLSDLVSDLPHPVQLQCHRTISSLGDRSFAAAGPRAWNKLPPPLRRVYSPDTFKRQLKTFLYNHAFNLHC